MATARLPVVTIARIDPDTGKSVLVHESDTKNGRVRRYIDDSYQLAGFGLDTNGDGVVDARVEMKGTDVTRVERDTNEDGRVDAWEYYDASKHLVKVGFSLAGDGVEDAWAFRDASNQIVRVEVSTARNGKVDRWEYYTNGKMVRVDQDTNKNGKVDRWSTYEDGILMDTFIDANEDGQPDDPVGR